MNTASVCNTVTFDVEHNNNPSGTRIRLGVVADDLDLATPPPHIDPHASDEAVELEFLRNDPAEKFLYKLAFFFQLDKDKIIRQRKSRQREPPDFPQHRPEQFGGDPLRKLISLIVENVYGSLLTAVDNLRSQGEGRFDFPARMDGSSVLQLIIQRQTAQALLLDNFLHYAADLHFRSHAFTVSRQIRFDKNYERANNAVDMSFRALKNNWRWDAHRHEFVYERAWRNF